MAFFESDMDLTYVERAILLEDIELPQLPEFPTLEELESGECEYNTAQELYTDEIGKFYIPILNPFADLERGPEDIRKKAVPAKNMMNPSCEIEISSYVESNYIELTIPKYIVLNFTDVIPKNTKFLVCFIGGSIDFDNIKVIGVD